MFIISAFLLLFILICSVIAEIKDHSFGLELLVTTKRHDCSKRKTGNNRRRC